MSAPGTKPPDTLRSTMSAIGRTAVNRDSTGMPILTRTGPSAATWGVILDAHNPGAICHPEIWRRAFVPGVAGPRYRQHDRHGAVFEGMT
jgi:hypothetical protein